MVRALCLRLLLLAGCFVAGCAGARTRSQAPVEQKPPPPPKPTPYVYVSGYRPEIQVVRLLTATGRLQPMSTAAAGKDPSFLAIRPGAHFLYAINEVDVCPGQPGKL